MISYVYIFRHVIEITSSTQNLFAHPVYRVTIREQANSFFRYNMPTTRSHTAKQAARQSPHHSGAAVVAPRSLEERRSTRLLQLLSVFAPNEELPESLRLRLLDILSSATEDIDSFKSRYYAGLSAVIIDAGKVDEQFFTRLNAAVPESFCAIDEIRKRIQHDFQLHDEFWSPEATEASLDAPALDASLQRHVARIGRISALHAIDKLTAVYAVGVLMTVLKGIARYHTASHPACDIHGDLLNLAMNEVEAFPEDVLPGNLDTIDSLIRTLAEADYEPSTAQQQLARRLEQSVRFISGSRKRHLTISETEGSSKRSAG